MKRVLRIGTFSQLGKVTIKTLRHYDEVGLLKPQHVDDETGYRYYAYGQLTQLHRILSLRQMGFSVPEVQDILNGRNVSHIMQRRQAELRAELQDTRQQLSRLEHTITTMKEGNDMEYQAVVKQIPACTIFAVRKVIPNYAALGTIMPQVGQLVSKLNPGVECVKPDYCFNLYLDGEYRDKDIQVEICQAVTAPGKDGGGVDFRDLPETAVVSVLHKGPYDGLRGAYAYAMQWVEQNGYTITGHPRESYVDGMWNKTDEADWLTEIQIPVEKQ